MSAQEDRKEKVYPGGLDRYVALRDAREAQEEALSTLDTNPVSDSTFLALVVAEELAGLAYLLDGIRYSARQTQSR
jgi:hypothetical protein